MPRGVRLGSVTYGGQLEGRILASWGTDTLVSDGTIVNVC